MHKRKLLLPVLVILSAVAVACGGSSHPACAASLTVHDVAVQHGVFTSYVEKGGGGGGSHSSGGGSHSSGGGSHSSGGGSSTKSGGGSKAPSNSGSHSGSKAPTVSGSHASTYKGPVTVDHSKYTYTAPGSTTHIVFVHQPSSFYNSHYNSHTVWLATDPGRFDPYNPWNYYNPYSPYYQVHLASC